MHNQEPIISLYANKGILIYLQVLSFNAISHFFRYYNPSCPCVCCCSGPVVGELLEDVIPVLAANLHPDKDVDVKLKFFSLLSRLIMNAPATLDSQHRYVRHFTRLYPTKAGKYMYYTDIQVCMVRLDCDCV